MSQDIPVVDPETVEATEPVDGLAERTVFQVDDRRLVRFSVEEASAWHRRRGDTYGWIRSGRGQLASADRARDLAEGGFLRLPGGTAHRYIAGDEGLEVLALVDGPTGVSEVEAPRGTGEGGQPEVAGSEDLVPTVESPALTRETPFPDAEVLMMRVRAAGGAAAGWHHHGDNVYFGYAVDGPSETQYDPSGKEVARIEIGECFHVPPGLVHRDTNPTEETHHGIIWLSGGEPWVVNVDGPA